jgi:hypothetical protein
MQGVSHNGWAKSIARAQKLFSQNILWPNLNLNINKTGHARIYVYKDPYA